MSALAPPAPPERGPGRVAWYEDAAPGLLTNKTVREFLSQYSQHHWPEIIKLLTIRGIAAVEASRPGQPAPAPRRLRADAARAVAASTAERALPDIRRQVLELQERLDRVYDDLDAPSPADEPAPAPPVVPRRGLLTQAPPAAAAAEAAWGQPTAVEEFYPEALLQEPFGTLGARPALDPRTRSQLVASAVASGRTAALLGVPRAPRAAAAAAPRPGAPPRLARRRGPVVAPKPPGSWREGEATGYPSSPRQPLDPLVRSIDNQGATNPIYPDWWGDPQPKPAPAPAPRQQPRPEPRLAYSLQQQENAPAAWLDDLVTAEYLLVPGSGYGQGPPPPVSAGRGPDTEVTIATASGLRARPAAPQERGAGGGGNGGGGAAALAAAAREAAEDAAAAEELLLAGISQASRRAARPARPAAASAAPGAAGRARAAAAGLAGARGLPPRTGVRFVEPPQPQELRRRVAGAESRIRSQVEASRRDAKRRARDRAARAAAAAAGGDGAAALAGGPGGGGGGRRAEGEGPGAPGDIVDEFLTNPWASWFLKDPAGGAAGGGKWSPPLGGEAPGGGEEGAEEALAEEEGVFDEEGTEGDEGAGGSGGLDSAAWLACLTAERQAVAAEAAAAAAAAASEAAAEAVEEEAAAEAAAARRQPWACDFGHLEAFAGPVPRRAREERARPAARRFKPGVPITEQLAGAWVGEFGHLDAPSFPAASAGACAEGAEGSGAEGAGAAAEGRGGGGGAGRGGGGLFMSPGELEAFVDAARAQAGRAALSAASRAALLRAAAAAAAEAEQGRSPGAAAAAAADEAAAAALGNEAAAEAAAADAAAAFAAARAAQAARAPQPAASSGSATTTGSSVDGLISSLLARIEEQQHRALAAAGLAAGAPVEGAGDGAAGAGGAEGGGADDGAGTGGRLGSAFSAMAGALRALAGGGGGGGTAGDDPASEVSSSYGGPLGGGGGGGGEEEEEEEESASILTLSPSHASTGGVRGAWRERAAAAEARAVGEPGAAAEGEGFAAGYSEAGAGGELRESERAAFWSARSTLERGAADPEPSA